MQQKRALNALVVGRWARRAWNWLTSMRTALILLCLLALGAVPGAILPQRAVNEARVSTYIAEHGSVATFYDKLQLFEVFSSHWFTAIYVLLFISLVGCIIPRTWEHLQAMRRGTLSGPPKRLERMPQYASGVVEGEAPEELIRRAQKELRGWKMTLRGDGTVLSRDEDLSVASAHPHRPVREWSLVAERGYLREIANLVFHAGLLGILVTVAWGRLTYYEGQVIVVAGTDQSEFCNTAVLNYDSFRHGPTFDGTMLTPFCVDVHDFRADYLPSGQAKSFASSVSFADGDDIQTDPSTWQTQDLRVNHPLRVAGNRVYLQGHGFAPTVTVTWPNGEKRTQTVQFQPDDATLFLSSGAMRFDPPAGMYPDLAERRTHQIAIQGLFAPTAQWTGAEQNILSSAFPAPNDPALAIDIYRGDAGLDSGVGQSIFQLDPAQIATGQLNKVDRLNVQLGESATLGDGTVVTFDDAKEFVNLQVSYDPAERWVLVSVILMLAGLAGSLSIKRRRIWVRCRAVEASEGSTGSVVRVETAGRAKTDRAGWGREHDEFARTIFGLPHDEDDDFDPERDAQYIRPSDSA